MTPEEKKIEEVAKAAAGFNKESDPYEEEERYFRTSDCRTFDACLSCIKSDAAKEYHTKGMWSNEEVRELLRKYSKEQKCKPWFVGGDKWFQQNKKK